MTDTLLPERKIFSSLSNKNRIFNVEVYIEKNEFLFIKARINKEKNSYENKYNVNHIKKNKYFQICESIYEIFLTLISIINSKEK